MPQIMESTFAVPHCFTSLCNFLFVYFIPVGQIVFVYILPIVFVVFFSIDVISLMMKSEKLVPFQNTK